MKQIVDVIDWTSAALARIVMAVVVVLVAVMIFEVIMRRFLNAPTVWAFDLSYMLNGCIFIGASSYALMKNEHVRVTFLSQNIPARARHLIDAAFYILLLLPALGFLAHASVGQAVDAYVEGTVERVSVWAPPLWPFYAGIAVGVCSLWLQVLAETLKALAAVWSEPSPAGALTPSSNPRG